MNLKITLPYLLSGAATLFIPANTNGSTEHEHGTGIFVENTANVMAMPPAENDNIIDYRTAEAELMAMATTATADRYSVVYTRRNGNKFKRTGGTRAWRNNNPGCVRYSDFIAAQGAIGQAGGFAVFPDEETGMRALAALLRSNGYRNLTIADAIFKYAPPHENNTDAYKARIRNMTGLQISLRIRDLTDAQIQRVTDAIRVIEGWTPGKETEILDTINRGIMTDTTRIYAARNAIIRNRLQKTI